MMAPARRETEAQFQQAVVDLARAVDWLVYHTYDSRRSTAGFLDLTLVRDERLIFAELKTDIGKVTDAQAVWIKALSATGVEVYVWRPRDWDVLVRRLKRPGRKGNYTGAGARRDLVKGLGPR